MKDLFTKKWIIENSINICQKYHFGVLTIRALHYQLVGLGMTNDTAHYKRVVTAMIDARWSGDIEFEQFSDLDREMIGRTEYEVTILEDQVTRAKGQVRAWMNTYNKNRWENQPYYPIVLIEKKALQGVFEPVCNNMSVSIGACKGYPSLTFLRALATDFEGAQIEGKKVVVLYFGDYDPSGEDIPRSIVENMGKFGLDIDLRRIALMEDQVREWNLPPAPAKVGDSRTANWDGLGQVELDAVKPERLRSLCKEAIDEVFDSELYEDLLMKESEEREIYRKELVVYVNSLNTEE
jgi:hypothetical protein